MSDIFISYAREDEALAARLAVSLEAQGWTVWRDRKIAAGAAFADRIEEELATAACVIVIWSQHSIASTWVRNEASEAASRNVLLPVLVSNVRQPLAFRHLQHGDLIAWARGEDAIPSDVVRDIDELVHRDARAPRLLPLSTTAPSAPPRGTERGELKDAHPVSLPSFRVGAGAKYAVVALVATVIAVVAVYVAKSPTGSAGATSEAKAEAAQVAAAKPIDTAGMHEAKTSDAGATTPAKPPPSAAIARGLTTPHLPPAPDPPAGVALDPIGIWQGPDNQVLRVQREGKKTVLVGSHRDGRFVLGMIKKTSAEARFEGAGRVLRGEHRGRTEQRVLRLIALDAYSAQCDGVVQPVDSNGFPLGPTEPIPATTFRYQRPPASSDERLSVIGEWSGAEDRHLSIKESEEGLTMSCTSRWGSFEANSRFWSNEEAVFEGTGVMETGPRKGARYRIAVRLTSDSPDKVMFEPVLQYLGDGGNPPGASLLGYAHSLTRAASAP